MKDATGRYMAHSNPAHGYVAHPKKEKEPYGKSPGQRKMSEGKGDSTNRTTSGKMGGMKY